MKQTRLATVILINTLFVSSTLFAAADKDMAINSYNWGGIYAGFNLGEVKRTLTMTDNQGASFLSTIDQESNPRFTGGFQFGYRHQLKQAQTSAVFGLELSADYTNESFEQIYGSPFALYQLKAENELKHLFMLQFIGGITADRALLFLGVGPAWANIKGQVTNLDSIPFFEGFSLSRKTQGAALSAGIEYAFTDRISARIKVDAIMPNTYTTQDDEHNRYQIANNLVQGTIGVNYRFTDPNRQA